MTEPKITTKFGKGYLGATGVEVADFFKVEVRTVYRWKADDEAFCHALKRLAPFPGRAIRILVSRVEAVRH